MEFYHDQKVSQTHYDENANITLDTDDNGNQTTYLYEDSNNEEQPTKVVQKEKGTDNVLSEQVYEYDDRGNETTVKDVINDVTTNKDYDESGNCVNSTTISKGEISNQDKFGYDNEGNETEVSHISGTVKENVERTYDQRGNVLREENKTSGIITSYVYNSFSEPIKIETMYPDGKTEVVEKEYDLGGRITKEKAADGTQTIYAYDKIGRVTGKKITKEDLVREENIDYSYEDIVVSGGGDIETRYPNARKQTITNQNGTIISVEYYDSVGSVIRTYKNGIYTDYLNDDAGHAVATILRGTSLNSGIAKTTVKTYDTYGNITATISNPSIENKQYVASGLGFGSVAHGKVIQAMLKEYEILLDGKNGVRMCPKLNTQALVALGLKQNGRKQNVCEAVIYPMDVLNPYNSATGKLEKTENTFSIHWYEATWMSKHLKIRGMITRPIHRIFGVDVFQRFRK